MGRALRSTLFSGGALCALPLFMLTGCSRDASTSPVIPKGVDAQAAVGSGSGPTVRSASPDSAPPNVTLDVRVAGSGYDPGSRVIWALNGDTAFARTKVHTNSTQYVSSRELLANITIAADAVPDLYDLVVLTAGGKKGIGIELFAITIGPSGGPYRAQLDDAASYKLRSDDGTTYTDGSRCVYTHRSAGGFYQLRTISNTVACKAVQRPGWRWFSIDLGASNSLDLDQDGVAEPVENAPARLLIPDAFANGASSTSVQIYILKVNTDGSTTQDAAWDLVYSVPAGISTTSTGGRIITAGAGAVSVSQPSVVGRKLVWSQVGTVSLPFKLMLEP